MDPVTLMAIANAGQAGLGIYQGFKANKLAKNLDRPDFEIPQEIYQNLDDAEIQALEGLPAAQKQAYLENIQRGTQTALGNISSRKGPGFEYALQSEADQQKQLLGQDVAQRQANQANLQSQRGVMADYKNKEWEDRMSAYTDAAQNVKDLTGASIENVVGAGQNMLGQFLDYKMYKDLLGVNPVDKASTDVITGITGANAGATAGLVTPDQTGTYTTSTDYLQRGVQPVTKSTVAPFDNATANKYYNFLTGKYE
jgi:hypothetical protein